MIRFRHGIARGFLCAVMSGSFLLSPAKTNAYTPSESRAVSQSFSSKLANASLFFTENRGQVADVKGSPRPDVLFTSHSGNTDIYLSANGISYQFKKINYPTGYDARSEDAEKQEGLLKQATTETYNFSLSLEGANPHPHIVTAEKATTVFNYYLAQCPNGITNVASYHKLVYEEVYPHIDWVIYSDGSHLKYDFIVKPGGDPSVIKLKIKDAASVSLTATGELLMKTSLGEIKEKAPLSYSNDKQVKSSFRMNADGTIGFDAAAQPGQTLRIDPAVVWSTYFGGTSADFGYGSAYDGNGHIYLTGYAASTGLASGGYQNTQGGSNDAVLAKFDSSGYLLWATYYGNTGDDQGYACVTDASGNVYLAGRTTSTTGIATAGATQTSNGGGIDAMLVKFDASGNRLWATFYGGSGTDQCNNGHCVTVDGSGNVLLCGVTGSASNIAAGTGFQQTIGATTTSDGFLAKFNTSGTRLWGTYYGGAGTETGNACATDASGNIYFAGQTSGSSTGISTSGAYQATQSGGTDTYIVKFDANGGRTWGTYYGHSSGGTTPFGCIVDASGNIYLTGTTTATSNIASSGSFQSTLGGLGDAFLAKFNSAGTSRVWATYYGGTGSETARGCSFDASGNIYITGFTNSPNVIGTGGFQSTLSGSGTNDAFIAQFSNSGSRIWGSYFGGTGSELAYYCVPDASGNIYMSGQTGSTAGIAKPGTYQSTYGGGSADAYLVKIGDRGLFTDSVSINLCTGAPVTVPYSLFGVYNSGNTFTAQLSDASGSFASPVNIGSVTSTAAGTIAATIPAGTPPGTGYRIRVISSNPVIIGTNNGTNLTIGLTTNPTVTLSVSPNDTICLGTPVTFTAVASVPSPAFNYTWYKGSTLLSVTDTFYTTSTVANNDTFTVKISNNGCAVPASASIVMTVNTPVIPTISVSVSPNDTICSNTAITLTANVTNAGTSQPVWYKNNGSTAVGTGLTYSPTPGSVSNGDVFKAILTSNGDCVSTIPVKDSIKITVSPVLTPTISVSVSPNDTICAGTAITFTGTSTNGGSSPAPSYTWYKNGVQVGTGLIYTPAAGSVSNNDIFKLQMTVNDTTGCYSASLVKDSIKMTVFPVVTPTVSVQVSPNDTVCSGTVVVCTALTTGAGSGTPNWFTNGTSAGSGGTYSFTATANTWVKAIVTSTAACAAPATVADSVLIVVNPIVTPSVTISSNPGNTICAGQQVTFTANPLTGGTYQWFKNGSAILNATGNTYSTSTAATNDTFYVVMTSTAPCTTVPTDTSNYIIMTVNQNVVPGVTISSNAGSVICAGTIITFQALPTNGGTSPTYQWYVGATPTGANSPTFSVSPPNGSTVHVVMTSSLACANPDSAISNSINMTVISQVTPTITIVADPSDTACIGKPVKYTITSATGYNPGDSVTWKKGSNIVAVGTVAATSVYIDNAPDGTTVSATLHSTLPCANAAYVTSSITVPVKACCDAPQNITIVGLGVNGGIFSWAPIPGVVGYEYNATHSTTDPVTGQFTTNASCSVNTLAPGTYYLYVRTYCGNGVYSRWVRITFTTPTTGINTVPGDDYTMMIYPNPVSDIATVEISGGIARNTMIQVTDLSGRVISTTESKDRKFTIDMRDLASGMYMLRFNDSEHAGTVKINKL